MAIEQALVDRTEASWLLQVLSVSPKRAFKAWYLVPALRIAAVVLGGFALTGAIWFAVSFWNSSLLTVGQVASVPIGAFLVAVFGKWVVRVAQLRSTVKKMAVGVGLAVVGWIVVAIHLRFFDRLFLRAGRVPEREPVTVGRAP
jgi:hypothetical protein